MTPRMILAGSSQYSIACFESILATCGSKIIPTRIWSPPDRPSGRKMRMQPSVVAEWGDGRNIPVSKHASLSENPLAIQELEDVDLLLVVSYGLIIPRTLLAIPVYGGWNIHPSDLPQWRGASPLQSTILSGANSSALCLMQMTGGLDNGPVMVRFPLPLDTSTTTQDLESLSAALAGAAFCEVLAKAQTRTLEPRRQLGDSTYANKITKNDGHISFDESAEQIVRKLRAYGSSIGIFFMIDNVRFKILAAESRNEPQVSSARAANAGTVLARDGGDIHIATSEGILVIHEMQREGKQSMPAASVLDGLRIEVGGSLC